MADSEMRKKMKDLETMLDAEIPVQAKQGIKSTSVAETKKTVVHVTEVVRHGEQFVIPEKMGFDEAIDLLMRKKKYENEEVAIDEIIKGFVWDGALALARAIERKYGFSCAEKIPPKSFFDVEEPPRMIAVETGVTTKAYVPWGRFTLPGIDGFIETNAVIHKGMAALSIQGRVRRRHEKQISDLFDMARAILKEESIYNGKAFKLRIKDEKGRLMPLPMPSFIDTSKVNETEIVFSKDVEMAVATSIFAPIENKEACKKLKIPLKRGVLLSGPYGTGKTLLTSVTASKATNNGWTFIVCERADELSEIVSLARQYQPAVIFCEDIDRVLSGDRSVEMDDILNVIDGIESKSTELMIILTTNYVEKINRAMLRPGRLDAVINVLPPDADAVVRLLRLYGRNLIPENADLTKVAKQLAGTIPAVIRECVERSKLSAIKLGQTGELILTPEVIYDAVVSMKGQLDLLRAKQKETDVDMAVKLVSAAAKHLFSDVKEEASHNGAELEITN